MLLVMQKKLAILTKTCTIIELVIHQLRRAHALFKTQRNHLIYSWMNIKNLFKSKEIEKGMMLYLMPEPFKYYYGI